MPGYNVIIACQQPGSGGGTRLANNLVLGHLRARTVSSMTSPEAIRRISHGFQGFVVNWGHGRVEGVLVPLAGHRILNDPSSVGVCTNKLTFFNRMSLLGERAPRIVPYTDRQQLAQAWVNTGFTVVERNQLTGHSGAGIRIVEPGTRVGLAPLYTRYVKKSAEFRLHFINGELCDIQRKVRDPEVEDADINWFVRSHENGFIFQRNNLIVPEDVKLQARLAFLATSLDFGAVDVIWNARQQAAYVLEINTAPGLEGQTVETYGQGIGRMVRERMAA